MFTRVIQEGVFSLDIWLSSRLTLMKKISCEWPFEVALRNKSKWSWVVSFFNSYILIASNVVITEKKQHHNSQWYRIIAMCAMFSSCGESLKYVCAFGLPTGTANILTKCQLFTSASRRYHCTTKHSIITLNCCYIVYCIVK